MAKSFEMKYYHRIIALIIIASIIFSLAVMRAFEFQVVKGASYLDEINKNTAATVVIPAARGEILDRNGVPFTKNKAIFNVEFDYVFMKKDTENQIINNLIMLFEKKGQKWIDDLPITSTQPYQFIEGKEVEIKRLRKTLDVNEYATAVDCMEQIYMQCGIKKYENKKGKCTHCNKKIEECDYKGYSEEMSRKIAGVRANMLQKQFSRNNSRYVFAEDVTPEMVTLIREFSTELVGVEIAETALRTYISGDVAPHILGSMGPIYAEEVKYYVDELKYNYNDLVGKSGVEKLMNQELHGTNGEMKVIKNNLGDIIDIYESKPPVAGKNVKLTLDYNFQKDVQQILADYIKNFNETNKKGKKSTSASIVVLDVKTGGVLASVSYPYYDINEYKTNYGELLKAEGNPLMNYALNGTYRPGSTFKPVVAAAGLTEGTIAPSTTVTCNRVYTYWDDYQPSCLGHHGATNVVKALQVSCNIFFYDTGRQLGIDKINKYANLMGLGTDTGIELNAATGNMSSPEFAKSHNLDWHPGHVAQSAIGQMHTAVTPLQMAVEASTVANKGTRYNVHIIDSIVSNDNKKVYFKKNPTIASQFNLKDSDFKAISDGMVLAGQSLSSPNQLTDLGYRVAVKTGTPEVYKSENNVKTNHAFIAFAPVDEPEIAISCMVDDGFASHQMLRKILLAYEKTKGIVREPEKEKDENKDKPQQQIESQGNDQLNQTASSQNQTAPQTVNETASIPQQRNQEIDQTE